MPYSAAELDRIHRLARLRAQALRREAVTAFWSGAWARLHRLFTHAASTTHHSGA